MDGFFVAKFKVDKRTKGQSKTINGSADAVESVANGVAGETSFNVEEDASYIAGALLRCVLLRCQLTFIFPQRGSGNIS